MKLLMEIKKIWNLTHKIFGRSQHACFSDQKALKFTACKDLCIWLERLEDMCLKTKKYAIWKPVFDGGYSGHMLSSVQGCMLRPSSAMSCRYTSRFSM